MPGRNRREAAADREQKIYSAVMRVAGEMGCELTPTMENPNKLRGLCPFHEAKTLKMSRTLEVDVRNMRFACMYCNIAGPPAAFAALCWNVSVSDARELILAHKGQVGADRPLYKRNSESQKRLANTAVLTRAWVYYRDQVVSGSPEAMPALNLAARLGITLEQAMRAGMGMCTGRGLAEALRQTGITGRELRESPLFIDGNVHRERMAGRIVVAETEYSGAASWMTAVNPVTEPGHPSLSHNRPGTTGIPGPSPQLMGLGQAGGKRKTAVLTDDVRLHLVLRAENMHSVLYSQRLRDSSAESKREAAQRIAKATEKVETGSMILMMHDSGLRRMCAEELERARPGCRVDSLGKREIMRQLSPLSRDLENMLKRRDRETADPEPPDPEPPTEASPGRGRGRGRGRR